MQIVCVWVRSIYYNLSNKHSSREQFLVFKRVAPPITLDYEDFALKCSDNALLCGETLVFFDLKNVIVEYSETTETTKLHKDHYLISAFLVY